MTASINANYTPNRAAYRKTRAPVTVGQVRRALANLLHVQKRVTGADITGTAGNSVAGHGHSELGDGVPMLRMLASGYSFPATLNDASSASGELPDVASGGTAIQGGISHWTQPLIDVCVRTTGGVETRSPGGLRSIMYWSFADGATTIDVAEGGGPWLRALRVSPGCNYVGCRLVYSVLHDEDDYIGYAPVSVFAQLRSKEAASGDLDFDGADWSPDYSGAPLIINPGVLSTPYDRKEFTPGGGFASPTRKYFWIAPRNDAAPSRPIDLLDVQYTPVPIYEAFLGCPMASRSVPALQADVSLPAPQLQMGAVRVEPGTHNDFDLAVGVGEGGFGKGITLFVWGFQVYELPWTLADMGDE